MRYLIILIMLFVFNSCSDNGSKFIGVWHSKGIVNSNKKGTYIITKSDKDYIITSYYANDAGDFNKFPGKLYDNRIIINKDAELTLINDNTLSLANFEFTKYPVELEIRDLENDKENLKYSLESQQSQVDNQKTRLEDLKGVKPSAQKDYQVNGTLKRLEIEEKKFKELENKVSKIDEILQLLQSI